MNKTSFPLRIHEDERQRGRHLAEELGISENRLYAELIHDGLLIREQMRYMDKLREIASSTTRQDALGVLDKALDTPPAATDRH